jgi:hypothetical protein
MPAPTRRRSTEALLNWRMRSTLWGDVCKCNGRPSLPTNDPGFRSNASAAVCRPTEGRNRKSALSVYFAGGGVAPQCLCDAPASTCEVVEHCWSHLSCIVATDC